MKREKYYALCVDDDQAVLNQLEFQLKGHYEDFCEFEYAESAEEALTVYHELITQGKQVWLVISDQVMSGMTGDELLARIHELDPRVIKVLLTGQAGLEDTVRAINHAGLNYYIEKPWTKEDLLLVLDRLKFQYEITTILNEMNLRFASSIDLDETLNTVFYNILNIIQAEAGSIFLVEPDNETLVCKICQGPKNIRGFRLPIGTGIVGHVVKTRQIDITTDVKRDIRHNPHIDEESGFVTKSMISVPLISKDETIGAIQVINKKGGKMFSREDVNLLQALSSGAALALQNAQYAQRLLQEERIRSELFIAYQIQQSILPDPFEGHSDIHIEAFNEPAKDVGGDFYDYFQVSEHEFAFVIGDVCGKGVPAAIFMASSRSIIKSQVLADPHPVSVIPLANKLIAEDAHQHGLYVTVFYGLYNTETHILRYTNAGHTLALLFRPSISSCSSFFNANLPLGMFKRATFEHAEAHLQKGDVLVFYTDGINEAENTEGEQFGIERLVNIILEYGDCSPKELKDTIVKSVNTFSRGQEQRDDITLMIVRV
jgi:sigma-B regulation protein RsbU (phosphoserine phosphatase)